MVTALVCIFISVGVRAGVVQFSTEDAGSGAFPNVLVIVKSLDSGREVFRALSDEGGHVSGRDLKPGLYRVIATCPYGLCQTKVQEFLVGEKSFNLTMRLSAAGTVDSVILGGTTREVQVLGRDGNPLSGALLIARDTLATHETWYKTDGSGKATITLTSDPTVLVIFTSTNLFEYTVGAKDGTPAPKIVVRMPQ